MRQVAAAAVLAVAPLAASNALASPAAPHQPSVTRAADTARLGPDRFLQAAYTDFLGRPPTGGEATFLVPGLRDGSVPRSTVVNQLARSREWVSALVNQLYVDTLGRPGDPGGVGFWVNEIASGRQTATTTAAQFYASDEYFRGIGGNTNRSWVTDLYQKILLRSPDQGGLDHWVGQVGATGRVSVAGRFYQSSESAHTRVDKLYRALLGRPADAGGAGYWAGRVVVEGDVALAADLASSVEYHQRALARFPAPPDPPADAVHGWFEPGQRWSGDFGDPHVLRSGSTYYAYSSPTAGRYLPVLTSTDLSTFTIRPRHTTGGPPGAGGYDVNADPQVPGEIRAWNAGAWDKWNNNDGLVAPAPWGLAHPQGWITRDLWAPGVIQIGTTWFAYSAVKVSNAGDDPNNYGRFCITVATSTSPTGPFRDASGGGPVQCQSAETDPSGSIDPYPYRDDATGTTHLLWKAAGRNVPGGRESTLKSVQVGNDGRPLWGAPVVDLLSTNRSQPWQGGTIENPAMISYGGDTYLFYSANSSNALDGDGHSDYATGYARCPNGPRGGCVPMGTTPLLSSTLARQGPGGASAFLDREGRLRLAYAYFWNGENRRLHPNATAPINHPRRLAITQVSRLADGRLRLGG